MVILALSSNFQNCIKKTNKIPEYARDFKKEYLLIIGINKEFKYFDDNINDANRGLFENHKVARIKYFIKRFLKGQERCKLKDTNNFEISNIDVVNLIIRLKNFSVILNNILIFVKVVMMKKIFVLLILILVLKIFLMILNYFLVSLK